MKRLAFAAALTAGGLAGVALPATGAAEVRVLACEPEWAALAEEIGGDDVTVHSATHGRQDPHHIRARPSLIAQVRRADLLFCSGADLEVGWLPVLMQRGARNVVQPGQPGNLMAADHVELLGRPEVVDRSLGDIHPSGNPHVHLDPENLALLASELARRLQRIDSANALAYRERLESFLDRWSRAMARWRERASRLGGMQVIVHHKAWAYLIRWAGLERVAALERISGIPPTVADLKNVLARASGAGVKAIIRAPHEPTDASSWLAEKTGIPVVELPYTVGGHRDAHDLFALFEVTFGLLEEANDRS